MGRLEGRLPYMHALVLGFQGAAASIVQTM